LLFFSCSSSSSALLCDAAEDEEPENRETLLSRAKELYEEDLKVHPKNVWSVSGMLRVLELDGGDEEDNEIQGMWWKGLQEQQREHEYADVEVTSSCACSRVATRK